MFYLQGERLRIAPNKCCPDCATSVGSCEYEGEIVGVSIIRKCKWALNESLGYTTYLNTSIGQITNLSESCILVFVETMVVVLKRGYKIKSQVLLM